MRAWVLGAALAATACGSPEAAERESKAQAPPTAFDGALVHDAAAKRAHGERLSRVLGCRGCHTATLEGQDFYGVPASNLTREIRKYDDAQFHRLMREGVRLDGRELWLMPSEIFQYLGNEDMAALIAHLRTLAPSGPPTPPLPPFDDEVRKLIAEGKVKPAAVLVEETRSATPVDLGPGHALGRYITMVTCAECHGTRLEGGENPDLVVASAYSREEFEQLLTKGIPNGPRKLDLMALVAKGRFAHMTRHERDAVYAYLKARAERPQ